MHYLIKKTNQPYFFFADKNDPDGEFVETIMPFKGIEALENYLESIDEHYDKKSITITEADVSIKNDEKVFNKIERSDYGKGSNSSHKKVVTYQGRTCYITRERVNCFSCCVLYLCLGDKIDCVSQYILEAYGHKERKGHPQIA